jgi:hypothetical protein
MTDLGNRHVKTRVQHRCHGCQQIIPIGTEDVYTESWTNDGFAWTIYFCTDCQALLPHVDWSDFDQDEGMEAGDLAEGFKNEDPSILAVYRIEHAAERAAERAKELIHDR